ncbi:hypothetical protein M758_UG208400 [Ceratodon purpureus]|nr:hypothetical protein M758_UG208400 [Ceratodon purpureus]
MLARASNSFSYASCASVNAAQRPDFSYIMSQDEELCIEREPRVSTRTFYCISLSRLGVCSLHTHIELGPSVQTLNTCQKHIQWRISVIYM